MANYMSQDTPQIYEIVGGVLWGGFQNQEIDPNDWVGPTREQFASLEERDFQIDPDVVGADIMVTLPPATYAGQLTARVHYMLNGFTEPIVGAPQLYGNGLQLYMGQVLRLRNRESVMQFRCGYGESEIAIDDPWTPRLWGMDVVTIQIQFYLGANR